MCPIAPHPNPHPPSEPVFWTFLSCFREGEVSKKALKKQQKEAEKAAKKAQYKKEAGKENQVGRDGVWQGCVGNRFWWSTRFYFRSMLFKVILSTFLARFRKWFKMTGQQGERFGISIYQIMFWLTLVISWRGFKRHWNLQFLVFR